MSYLVKAQATYYPDMISVFIPTLPILKEYTVDPFSIAHGRGTGYIKDDPIERSIRRTKKNVKDYVLCNNFTIFATFTFAHNRYDIDEKRRQMSNWFKNQQKRNGPFDYLAIPELHKDGALHFHVLMSSYSGEVRVAINPKTNKPIKKGGRQIYVFPEYSLGFTNFRYIKQTSEDRIRVATYVAKYITKDMPIFKNKKRYFSSRSLRKPYIEDNPDNWYKSLEPDWEMEVKNGKIMRFLRANSKEVESLIERSSK